MFLWNVGRKFISFSFPNNRMYQYYNNIKLLKNTDFQKYNIHKINYCNETSETKTEYNRHCYDKLIEKLVNDQVNTEFTAAYQYLGMAMYYGRSTVALPGCYGFFLKMYYEEQQHAMDFMKYQTIRGGKVILQPINPLQETEFTDLAKALYLALEMEKCVKEKLQVLIQCADDVKDTDVENFLDPYIENQEKSIYEISRLYTRANELAENEIGRYLFDRELHETHVQGKPGKCTAEIGSKLYT